MRKLKLSELVFDYDLYPRAEVDSQHVHYMVEADQAGATFPPYIIDKKSHRVIDGFHRGKKDARLHGPDCEVEVIEKAYRNEGDMFLDAVRYNANHGRTLTTFDRAHCILRAEQLGIEADQVASALSLTCDAVGKLRENRVGRLRAVTTDAKGEPMEVPLKRTIAHMAGRSLTRAQNEVNGKLSGMQQAFYVNQVIMLIENGLLETSNTRLMERLNHLQQLLEGVTV